jgi:hypothetical protein
VSSTPLPISNYLLTAHAIRELSRRALDEETVRGVLASPEQRASVRPGREVLQSRRTILGREYLVRVFVDTDRQPPEVVTAYRTTKVRKYWRRDG